MNDSRRLDLAVGLIAMLSLTLPLLVGQRSAQTIAFAGLVMVAVIGMAALLTLLPGRYPACLPWPSRAWRWFAGIFTGLIVLQVWPSTLLARWFGPYPESMLNSTVFQPQHWSPNPSATLMGWSVFVGLFLLAWMSSRLRRQHRIWIWLALVVAVLFQALYGLVSHELGAQTIFGIWQRNNPDFVHGSFSNRNLFAGYVALLWPLSVAIWWWRNVPVISRLPSPVRMAGSLVCASLLGTALMATASRLGSVAGLIGMMFWLVLWLRQRGEWRGFVAWPVYLMAGVTVLAMIRYGLTPLVGRLAVTSVEESRFQMYATMLSDMPLGWWFSGIGLGGFEAAFRQVQPADMVGWYDHAHNDLLEWLLETGLVGAVLLVWVVVAIFRTGVRRREHLPLLAGLVALAVVGLGDFSWHIPATQLVAALFIGALVSRTDEASDLPDRRPSAASLPGRAGSRRSRKRFKFF